MYRRISFTQVGQQCGLKLKNYRDRVAQGPPSIAPTQGNGVHRGIEHQLVYGDPLAALQAARDSLLFSMEEAGVRVEENEDTGEWTAIDAARMRWDKPPKFTNPNRDWPMGRPYRGDEGNMLTPDAARILTQLQVTAWIERFGELTVTPLATCPKCGAQCEDTIVCQTPDCGTSLVAIERKEYLPLDLFGIPGWEMTVVYDVQPDEGGMIDIKVSASPWDIEFDDRGNPIGGKHFDKIDQALLYQLAVEELHGAAPEFFVFHNLPRSAVRYRVERPLWGDDQPRVTFTGYDASAIQTIRTPYSRQAALDFILFKVKPRVEAIEAGIWIPNTDGWWCSEAFCDYWNICPLGAARRQPTYVPEERGAA